MRVGHKLTPASAKPDGDMLELAQALMSRLYAMYLTVRGPCTAVEEATQHGGNTAATIFGLRRYL